jgi:predicted transcriptional regulator
MRKVEINYQQLAEFMSTKLTPNECIVLTYLLSIGNFKNRFAFNKNMIAEKIKLSKPTVAKCIKNLLERKILYKQPTLQDYRRFDYIIEHFEFWPAEKTLQYYGGHGELFVPDNGSFEIRWGNEHVKKFVNLQEAMIFYNSINEEKALWYLDRFPEVIVCHTYQY